MDTKKNIMRFYNLQNCILDKEIKYEDRIEIHIRSPRNSCRCPVCNTNSRHIHQYKQRKILHSTLNNKPVYLIYNFKRFKCKKCFKPFTEPHILGITNKKGSDEFIYQVIIKAKDQTFKSVARESLITSPTVVSYIDSFISQKEILDDKIILSNRICIDEHSYSGRKNMKMTIGNPDNKCLIGVLKNRNKETLEKFLKNADFNGLKEVCVDMHRGYINTLKEYVPHANIVVDHFHVIRELNRSLDEIRKIIQTNGKKGYKRIPKYLLLKGRENLSEDEKTKLKQIFYEYKNYSLLKDLYFIKEKIRDMYKSKTREEAEHTLNNLLIVLEKETFRKGTIERLFNMLTEFKEYILNFFISRLTNAFIEGCHQKIKSIKRLSYGFRNFHNYVLKLKLAFMTLPAH
jgi:transposase